MRRLPLAWKKPAAAALAAIIAACSTTPPTRFHTLMPADPPARSAAAPAIAIAAVLEPIRLPAQVDQPQWVVRSVDGGLAVLEQERWASPLRDELRDALREALTARWNVTELRPAVGDKPAVRITIEVRRFDGVLGTGSRMEGSWRLTPGDARRTITCDWFITEAASSDLASLAEAHRRAVATLAAGIGANLARLDGGSTRNCPAVVNPA